VACRAAASSQVYARGAEDGILEFWPTMVVGIGADLFRQNGPLLVMRHP